MHTAREYFDYLNHAYVAVHKAKEDLFWSTYMAISDDQAGFVRAEGAYKEFIGDPEAWMNPMSPVGLKATGAWKTPNSNH